MSRPRITAIVPVRDGERYLAAALDSVLSQSRPPDEVIVADDGSADGSAAVAEGFGDRVRVLRLEPRGPSAAVDSAMAEAQGDVIAMIDADDLWTPDKLEVQLEELGSGGRPDLVWGAVEQFISPDLGDEERSRLRTPLPSGPAKIRGTLLARRDAIERAGPFAAGEVAVGEFVDWYMRAADAGLTEAMVDRVVLRRRIHAANLTRKHSGSRADYARVIAEGLRRRREGG